jgi:hypothetical protein
MSAMGQNLTLRSLPRFCRLAMNGYPEVGELSRLSGQVERRRNVVEAARLGTLYCLGWAQLADFAGGLIF